MNSAWARLPYCLPKGSLKGDVLHNYLTTFSQSVNSKFQNPWRSSFFSKCSKFNLDLQNAPKNSENVFCLFNNWSLIGIVKLYLLRTGYLLLAANVLRSSPKIWHVNKRDFKFQLTWKWSMNMIKVLWCGIQQCLGTHTMLLVEGFSEMGIFRHLSDYVFRVLNFEIPKSMRVIFFFKNFKICSTFQKSRKNFGKGFLLLR